MSCDALSGARLINGMKEDDARVSINCLSAGETCRRNQLILTYALMTTLRLHKAKQGEAINSQLVQSRLAHSKLVFHAGLVSAASMATCAAADSRGYVSSVKCTSASLLRSI